MWNNKPNLLSTRRTQPQIDSEISFWCFVAFVLAVIQLQWQLCRRNRFQFHAHLAFFYLRTPVFAVRWHCHSLLCIGHTNRILPIRYSGRVGHTSTRNSLSTSNDHQQDADLLINQNKSNYLVAPTYADLCISHTKMSRKKNNNNNKNCTCCRITLSLYRTRSRKMRKKTSNQANYEKYTRRKILCKKNWKCNQKPRRQMNEWN